MNFFKKIADGVSTVVTGGAYTPYSQNGWAQGGGVSSIGNIFGAGGDKSSPIVDYTGQTNSAVSGAKRDARSKINKFYGNSLDNIGDESSDYSNRIKSLLDKDVAKADVVNQQGSQERRLDNARAGLSGVDLTAQNEQNRRNAGFEANVINEEARRGALDLYGNSISNRISGANAIENQEVALAIASMQQPVQQSNPGLIGSIFSGLF